MANNTQAAQTLLSHQAHTHSITDVTAIGSTLDVKTSLSAGIWVYHANIETTANATGVKYILQGSWNTTSTVNEDWVDIITFQTGTVAAVAAEIAGAEAIGQTQITVDADPTAAFLRGIDIYIEDTGTVTDGEWAKTDHSVAATDVFIVDGLTVAKDASDTMWTQAEKFYTSVDLGGFQFVRMIMQHTAVTGSNIHFKAEMVEVTDFA